LPFCHAHLEALRPLPRSYPQVIATIRDHPRKRRLDLGLLQREVAERLGADYCSVTNWELNRTSPALRFLPGIIRLIGYVPVSSGPSMADRLRHSRRSLGLAQKRLAGLLGVDESTVARWERGSRHPRRDLRARLGAVLGQWLPAASPESMPKP
jgi:transcriptional regulator with XRE-family HTH domain